MKKSITVRNVSKEIGGKKILDNISFDAYEGEIIGLVGKNGAGKSTLLKLMTGLYTIDEGDIIYYDYNLKYDYEKAMSIVGTIIETPDMYKTLSGKKNLELFKTMFKGVNEETIEEIVRILEMEKYLGKKFKTYSLGMKERLAIASSLINKPKILILDEPTNGLDTEGIKKVMNILKDLKDLKDTTIIISSHMLNEIEDLCNKIIFINNGKIQKIKMKQRSDKKNVVFEVDDYSKATLLLNDYCINEKLEVYENDKIISELNKKLVNNDIKVYRISEKNNKLEEEFFEMLGNNDKSN